MADFLIVKSLRMLPCVQGDAENRVQAHAAQAPGRAHARAFSDMSNDLYNLLFRELAAEKRRAAPLGEILAADGTVETTNTSGLAGPAMRSNRGHTALAKGFTLGVGTGKLRYLMLFHDISPCCRKREQLS